MVSRGFHSKWTGSKQVSPKHEFCEDEKVLEVFICKEKKNCGRANDEKTENIHFSFFNKDLQALILKFKTDAVRVLQRFFRKKLFQKKNFYFKRVMSRCFLRRVLPAFNYFKVSLVLARRAARIIQRFWRDKMRMTRSLRSSPLRKLLAHTVSVGSKLRRINSMISTVYINRTLSSPESQSALTPDKKKLSILYNKRSSLHFHKRTSSLPDILKDILNDDPNSLSNETIPEIPLNPFQIIPEIRTPKSFVMKRESFKVRPRKVKKMNLEELDKAMAVDFFRFSMGGTESCNSCIPFFVIGSESSKNEDWKKAREELNVEYQRILEKIRSNKVVYCD
jgi:hypothetical protein